MNNYNPKEIEPKWQAYWEKNKTFKTPTDVTLENKEYVLPQLPYPSGSGLHVGHAEVYTACDIYARFQRMQGKKVLQVIGWDSFGLPAENYAIKTNVHPKKSTNDAIKNFRKQIKSLGISVDWEKEVASHNPDYYKFTQWLFQLMYKRGLAYRKKQAVNWCESCKTVLANEQVTPDGKCERCDTVIIQKQMEQWYIKITDYAEKLLEGLGRIDWPKETITRQKNWIGKSQGAEINFSVILSGVSEERESEVEGSPGITVFTTRPDTIFGATYIVLAPEHQLIKDLQSSITNWKDVKKYINETKEKTDLDRQIDQEKTGVELQGIKAINPVTGEEIPIWIADYVLASYGTGAIMAVPGHDQRDWEFVQTVIALETREPVEKFVKNVVQPKEKRDVSSLLLFLKEGELESEKIDEYIDLISEGKRCFPKEGITVNSGFLNHLPSDQAKEKIVEWLEERGLGKKKIQYKLRDWSVSRQRFWGAPIPMIKNEEEKNKKRTFILVHGFTGSATSNFFPSLKKYLEEIGHTVWCQDLPNTDKPSIEEQADFIIENNKLTKDTVILGHSLGGSVVMKVLEKTQTKVAKVILSDSFYIPKFSDKERPDVVNSSDWKLEPKNIKHLAKEWTLIIDNNYPIIPKDHSEKMAKELDARIVSIKSLGGGHFDGKDQPEMFGEVPVSGLKLVDFFDMPVLLPEDVDFKPTGQSPLTYSENFQSGVEEKYGKEWKREVDTLDTFMCSSWYYYRYLDPKNEHEFASPEALKQWMPVDFYLGGEEHVNGHLLYSRFITKVLFDAGYIEFDEPFTKHRHQGLILGDDSRKMSKRWGNVVNPTEVVDEFGADTCRMYEMFMGPLEEAKPWNTNGVKGVRRFLDRVWRLFIDEDTGNFSTKITEDKLTEEQEKLLHQTIKKVGYDTGLLGFNTAIASMMEFVNTANKWETFPKELVKNFTLLLSPYAPHMTEELWEKLGNTSSLSSEPWPEFDESKLTPDTITVVIQINGKVRDKIEVPREASEYSIKTKALSTEKILQWLDGKEPKKVIYVKGKLVSIVV